MDRRAQDEWVCLALEIEVGVDIFCDLKFPSHGLAKKVSTRAEDLAELNISGTKGLKKLDQRPADDGWIGFIAWEKPVRRQAKDKAGSLKPEMPRQGHYTGDGSQSSHASPQLSEVSMTAHLISIPEEYFDCGFEKIALEIQKGIVPPAPFYRSKDGEPLKIRACKMVRKAAD